MKISGVGGALFFISVLATFACAFVGRIAAVNGDVSIHRADKIQKAVSNFKLEEKDFIKSTLGSTVQLIFNDNTIVTVGSDTVLKIDEYLFEDKNSKARFKAESGTFKIITGKIAKVAPQKFKVDTKMAAVGIRGTIFVGRVDLDGNLTVACLNGAIEVTPFIEGFSSKIVKEGEITMASQKGVETPRRFTPSQIQDLEKPLIAVLRDKIGQVAPLAPILKESDEFRLFERISSYIALRKQTQPLVLATDAILPDKPLQSIQEAIAANALADKIDLILGSSQALKQSDFATLLLIKNEFNALAGYSFAQNYPLAASLGLSFGGVNKLVNGKLDGLDTKNIGEILNNINSASNKSIGALRVPRAQ